MRSSCRTKVAGKPYLIVPYTHATNDTKFGLGVFATGNDFIGDITATG